MHWLPRYLLILVVLSGAVPTAFAQLDIDRFDGRVFGVGTSHDSSQALAGAGLDLNLTPRISVAVDGDLWFSQSGVGLGTILAGAVYHFKHFASFIPYARAGLAGYLLSDATHGVHLGGGIEHAIGSNKAIQVETLLLTTQNSHFEFRVGLVFR